MTYRRRSDCRYARLWHVAEQYATPPTLADRTVVLVPIEYQAGRINNLEATLQLDRLQVLGMSRVCCNCAPLAKKRTFRTQRPHANERREWTLDRFSELIRLLLPTFGNQTTPTITLCAALGLQAFKSRSSAGAVAHDRFDRWLDADERNGSVGV